MCDIDFKFLALVSSLTIFSSSSDGKKRGDFWLWAGLDYDISSQSLFTVVILSFTVGNIIETSGDLPVLAEYGLKLTKSGLISPRGL